jgi:hypothetical protein
VLFSNSFLLYQKKDMGEDYSDDEIDLIVGKLDPDGLKSIEFSEFVRWWCAGI